MPRLKIPAERPEILSKKRGHFLFRHTAALCLRRAQRKKKKRVRTRSASRLSLEEVDTLDAAPPMYKTKQGQRSYRTPDFLNGSQAYTRFLLPLWNINKNADCIAIGIFVRVRKEDRLPFFQPSEYVGITV